MAQVNRTFAISRVWTVTLMKMGTWSVCVYSAEQSTSCRPVMTGFNGWWHKNHNIAPSKRTSICFSLSSSVSSVVVTIRNSSDPDALRILRFCIVCFHICFEIKRAKSKQGTGAYWKSSLATESAWEKKTKKQLFHNCSCGNIWCGIWKTQQFTLSQNCDIKSVSVAKIYIAAP